MDSYDVIIVGSGPAGTSTALHLLHRNPAWASRILILEKEHHPRLKLCGGGLTEWGEQPLRELGLRVPVPHVEVREARFTYDGISFSYWGKPVIRVTRRDEFDDWLCRLVKEKGVRVNEGEAVVDVRLEKDGVRVTTTRGEYCAEALVGADGSKGLVRRKLGLKDERHIARLLEVLTPEDPNRVREFVDARANFDFTPLASGMQGYYWDFPSWVRGRAFMNRGVYDSRADADAPRAALKTILAEQMARRQRTMDAELHGHPIHWFDPRAPLSRPRAILVGDAAGSDPLFGEGIGYALAYGRVAARAIERAFATGDFSFRNYRRCVLFDWVGRDLSLRWLTAGIVYRLRRRPRAARLAARIVSWVISLVLWANRGKRHAAPPRPFQGDTARADAVSK
ncbi:MAG: FAD-dependent monooxygenase [Chloroflexi bacterium]|nr:FAD-dependent monooxygenase [Chloroflexota bacterium]